MKITDLQQYSVVSKARSQNPQVSKTKTETTGEDSPFLRDVGTGAAKELASTGLGVGQIGRGIQKILSSGVDLVTGTKGFGLGKPSVFDKGSEAELKAREALQPEGIGEKIGSFGTELATFAIPGGAATKATKGSGLLARTGALGATDLTTAAIQSGGVDKEAIDAGIISAAFPVAGKGASLAKGLLPEGADVGGRVINSLIKPLLKDFSYGKNPGRAVAEAGITANSLDELAVNIRTVRQDVGQQIADKVAKSDARFNATDSMKSLDDAIVEAQKSPRTNSAIISRLQNLKDDLLQVGEDGLPTRNLSDLSASELFDLKRDIGDLTRWTGNATDDEIVNKALKQTYGKIKGQLDSKIDGISDLNTKYADLKSAEIATEYRDKIAARQGLIGFGGQQAGIAAGLVTAAATGGITAGLLVGATATGIAEAAKTPAFKTNLAAWLASASKAEKEDAFKKAPWLKGAVQAALFDDTEDNQ